ncbi:MAG: hypothetical protein ACREP2_06405 [Rhodanobacteraceae bacterium]
MDSGQIFVLCIILLALAAGLVRHFMRMQQFRPRDNPEYQARIDALEHRVQTLERIITDKGYDLKREFDRL